MEQQLPNNYASRFNPFDEFREESDALWERVQLNLSLGMMLRRGQARSLMDDLSRLRELAEPINDPIQRGRATVYLAYVIHRRDSGDPSRNTEHAIQLAEEAIEYFTNDIDAPLELAWAYTTIGMLYNERDYSDPDEPNDAKAERCLRRALAIRRESGSEVDIAYTASTLADTLGTDHPRFSDEEVDLRLQEAQQLVEPAIDTLISSGGDLGPVGGQAALNHGHRLIRQAERQIRRRCREFVRANVSGDPTGIVNKMIEESGVDRVSDRVFSLAQLARTNPEVLGGTRPPEWTLHLEEIERPNPAELRLVDEASRLSDLVHRAFGNTEVGSRSLALKAEATSWRPDRLLQATTTYQEALDSIAQVFDPFLVAKIGGRAGDGWARLHNWEKAAKAFIDTLQAIEEIHDVQIATRDQDETLAQNPKLIENAAYALVRCGKLRDAVRVLESGRARRLTRRILTKSPSVAAVRSRNSSLADSLESYITDKAEVPSDLLREIRSTSGLGKFPIVLDDTEILAASTPGCPLVYVISTPAGTATLVVEPGSTDLVVSLIGDTDVTSSHLSTYFWSVDLDRQETSGLYTRDAHTLETTLTRHAEALGRAFGRCLADYLLKVSADSVTLVPTGLLGSSPISAAIIDDSAVEAEPMRLVDIAALRIVPSALFFGGLKRRYESRPSVLDSYVGIGDAEGPSARLLNAEAEIRTSAARFVNSSILLREEATLTNFQRLSAGAQVIHFACHGYADYRLADDSYLELSDARLSVSHLLANISVSARVALLSACESAQYASLEADSNQVLGLATAFLATGASTTVASLAQIDDLAAFALTQRYFIELMKEPDDLSSSMRSLQSAQLWLKNANRLEVANDAIAATNRLPTEATRGVADWIKSIRRRESRHNRNRKFQLRDWSQFVNIGL